MIVLAEEIHMDAAQKLPRHSFLFSAAMALILAAPAWAVLPSFTYSPSGTIALNQANTGGAVTVDTSVAGSPITFTTSVTYANDGGNSHWLQVNAAGSQTTPST
ncbi:MAG: hypothetical protein KGN36_12515, partial [Acidobacteriota bacterium]|nr:hypothetical protein [Acidobacteriota bacterium]